MMARCGPPTAAHSASSRLLKARLCLCLLRPALPAAAAAAGQLVDIQAPCTHWQRCAVYTGKLSRAAIVHRRHANACLLPCAAGTPATPPTAPGAPAAAPRWLLGQLACCADSSLPPLPPQCWGRQCASGKVASVQLRALLIAIQNVWGCCTAACTVLPNAQDDGAQCEPARQHDLFHAATNATSSMYDNATACFACVMMKSSAL